MKKQLLVLAAVCVLLGTGLFAVVSVSAEPQSEFADQRLAERFDVLDETGLPSTSDLNELGAITKLSEASGLGAATSLHSVAVPKGQVQVVGTEDSKGACLVAGSMSTCGSLVAAESAKLFGLMSCSPGLRIGQVELVGLVPNGIDSVIVNVQDHRPVSAFVVDNVVGQSIDGYPVSVEWASPNGPVKADLPGDPSMMECS